MPNRERTLSEYTVELPIPFGASRIPEDTEPGLKLSLLTQRAALVQIGAGVNKSPLTALRLSWIWLWSRNLGLIDTAITALGARSHVGMHAAVRSTVELRAHLGAVFRPMRAELRLLEKFGSEADPSDHTVGEVRDRLIGLIAWGLANDRAEWQRRLARVRELYTQSEPLAFESDMSRLAFEWLYGERTDDPADQLARERDQAIASINSNIDRINALLSDASLRSWAQKADNKSRQRAERCNLFQLLGDDEVKMREQLEYAGMGAARFMYSLGSMVLHGSSVGEFVEFAESVCVPRVTDDTVDVAPIVIYGARYTNMELALIKKWAWDNAT